MNILILVFFLLGRVLTVFSCFALCKGKWRKIRARVVPRDFIERITLSYLWRARTDYPRIMRFEIIAIHVETVSSVLCVALNLLGYMDYMLIWALLWVIHLTILTSLFQHFVRK